MNRSRNNSSSTLALHRLRCVLGAKRIVATFRPSRGSSAKDPAAAAVVAAAAALGFAATRCAADITIDVATASGLNVAIPDDGYTGTVASMAAVNLQVTAPTGALITSVRVVVSMSHTWVGDLVIKLRATDDTLITLMSRPGFAETADDGTGGTGNSSNLLLTFPVEFQAGAAASAENMGSALTNAQVVCRDNAVCIYAPNNGAAAAGNFATFNGKNPAGTWKLLVGDAGLGDTGTINQWRIIMTASVPCPADITADHVVDVNDLLSVITHWGACPGSCPPHCTGDVAPTRGTGGAGGDCAVDVNDLLLVITNWGACL